MRSCQVPLFENLVGDSTPLPPTESGRCTLWPNLGQKSFKIWNRIQCCLKKNPPVFNLRSNLVCKFKFNICNDIYYRKTKCHFKVRACKHLGITPLTGRKETISKESAAFDIFHTGHNPSFDDFENLAKESDQFRLLFRELLLILLLIFWYWWSTFE